MKILAKKLYHGNGKLKPPKGRSGISTKYTQTISILRFNLQGRSGRTAQDFLSLLFERSRTLILESCEFIIFCISSPPLAIVSIGKNPKNFCIGYGNIFILILSFFQFLWLRIWGGGELRHKRVLEQSVFKVDGRRNPRLPSRFFYMLNTFAPSAPSLPNVNVAELWPKTILSYTYLRNLLPN